MAQEEDWSSTRPKFTEPPATVAISLDGTGLLRGEDGWRETMVGTRSCDDREGPRQPTVYLAATPEDGTAKFFNRLEAEVGRAKAQCPGAHEVGIADGATGNWEFLERVEFEDVKDAQEKGAWFRREYNAVRPPSSLDYATPKEFSGVRPKNDVELRGCQAATGKPPRLTLAQNCSHRSGV